MDLYIGWASQSGNATDLLRQFVDACAQEAISITAVQQINQDIQICPGCWVFFVSTTGQGNPPYHMRTFWKEFMKKSYKLPAKVYFTVYSLGDRAYGDHFGITARKFRQRLKMLGGEEFTEIGLGDDSDPQGYRQVYLNHWRNQVISFLRQKLEKKASQSKGIKQLSLRRLKDEIDLQIVQIKELSSHKSRRTFWAKLQVFGGHTVKEGDVIQIFPHNRKEDVEFMLKYFQKQGEEIIQYKHMKISIRKLFTQYLNLSYIVNYYFFVNHSREVLVNSTKDSLFQEKLREFASNYEQYFNFIKKYKRNVIEFIRDFDLQLPFDYFLENINEVIGRKYSIAKVQGKYIYLLIKIIDYHITEGRLYRGLCSNDLFKSVGEIRRGKILGGEITPKQVREHNIIVTLGTGIAPFIWVLQGLKKSAYKCLLVYTNSFKDQLFHQQLVNLQGRENYEEIVSLTREGGPKIIRLLQQQAERLYSQISKVGVSKLRIFYCGPKEVYQYLLTFIGKLLGIEKGDIQNSKMIIYQNW